MLSVFALGLSVIATTPAARAATDPAEVAFWQSADASKDPREYQLYLDAYPNGAFATLARMRLGSAPQRSASNQGARPDPNSPYRLTAVPPVAPHGTATRIVCTGFGEPALFDWLVIVPSGSREYDPGKEYGPSLMNALPHIQTCTGTGLVLPVLPPGSYEARYLAQRDSSDGPLRVLARVVFMAQ